MKTSHSPITGETIATRAYASTAQIQEALTTAHQTYTQWKKTNYSERATLMHRIAEILEEDKETYARIITKEMGKVIIQARKEIEKCAWVCRHYADNTETMLADQHIATESSKSYVRFEPLGVILAVMPWNFPFYQVMRCAAPIIMAGNTLIVKHASNVQESGDALQEAFKQAGFPTGVFTNVNINSADVKSVIESPHITAVTLTGSDATGRAVASVAGQNLKKTVMELGGSDAYIVLDDANIEKATDLALVGRLQNTGQTCIAAKRFIVIDDIYDAFVAMLKDKMQAATMGDPFDEASYYGPMARVDLRDELHQQVMLSIKQGASCLLGGVVPDQPGAWYPATLLVDITPGIEAFDNELFGPVAAVVHAKNEEHAIELANQSQFGLGSGVCTTNIKRGERIAHALEAGNSFVNSLVVSDPRLPFGGIKNSGYGRELAEYGIREFVNAKTISIA